ncbi:MAG: disulfide bond formation protein B [Gammaproteobacteria bacterium]|nr:disulfide bond formation protein B [Gammaproteobacteria bacterium]
MNLTETNPADSPSEFPGNSPMTVARQRWVLILVVLTVAGLLGYGYYLQYVEYMDPCPLCMTQRFFYYLIGIAAILALLAVRRVAWQKLLAVVMMLSALGGIVTAGRQIWLQHLPPDKVPECGLGLQYWMDNYSYLRTLQLLFQGDGNCAEVDLVLGMSIANWSLGFFIALGLVGAWLFACRDRVLGSAG